MSVATTARLRTLVIRFDNYKKSPYVSMREHLRHMSNMISELTEMDYKLIDEQQGHAVIHFLPNNWGHMKIVLSQTKYILNFQNIRRQFEVEEEH